MNWEAVTAIGTVFTGLVILVTVILGRRQLDQLRRATQLEGTIAVFAELDGPAQSEARRFVQFELPARMKDEKFRGEVVLVGAADESVHKELLVLRTFERIGAYINEGLLEGSLFHRVASGRILGMWRCLGDVVEVHRESLGPWVWENFERLYRDTLRWVRALPETARFEEFIEIQWPRGQKA